MASLLLAGLIVGLTIMKSDEVMASLKHANGYWAAAGLGCYWVNYLFRSMRFCTISSNMLKFWPDAVKATCLHGLAAYMLPLQVGDLTLPVILKTINHTEWMEGGRILIKSRILDVSTLGFCMICSALFAQVHVPVLLRTGWMATGVAMLFSAVWINLMISLGLKLSSPVLIKYVRIFETVSINWQEVVLSMGIWAAIGECIFCAARAVGLALGSGDVVFLISVQLPLQLIPVQGFANAGNHEGGWIAALAILGIPASDSLTFALASHALVLVYVMSLGAIALIARK